MKKIIQVALASIFLLTGCTKHPAVTAPLPSASTTAEATMSPTSTTTSDIEATATPQPSVTPTSTVQPSVSTPVPTSSTVQTEPNGTYTGKNVEPQYDMTYTNTRATGFSGEGSSLYLGSDYTFILTEIDGYGADLITGTFGVEGNVLMFMVTSNFWLNGEQVLNFEFFVQDDGSLILNNNLVGSAEGDRFVQNPTAVSPSYPENTATTENSAWVNITQDSVLPEYRPAVYFFEDGTFVFLENLYSGLGRIYGTYYKDGERYICTVTDNSELQGYAGYETNMIFFDTIDDTYIELNNSICMSQGGNWFQRN